MKHSAVFVFAAALFAASLLSAQSVQPASASGGTRRDIVSYVEELAGNTAAQLRLVQDENAELETRVIELERKLAALQETNQKLVNDIAAVKRQAAADSDAHEKQMNAISSKIDKLAATLAATPAPVAATPVSAEADYDIYEVQKNATLYVIAQAYGVTVQDIKKANNLKNDTIHVGQKLKIPKK